MIRERSASSGACRDSASRIGMSDSVSLRMPGAQPTVEMPVRRWVMPRSGRRRAEASTFVEVHHRLAHPHVDEVVERLDAAEVQDLVEDLRGGQVAAELHRAGRAERARQRAARLRGDADRATAVAIAHEHGLDRAAVVGVEERLDGAVARVRLVGERERRVGDLGGEPVAQRRPAGRSSRRSRRRRPRSSATPGGRGRRARRRRRACGRGARGPRLSMVAPPCGSPSTSPTPGSPPGAPPSS